MAKSRRYSRKSRKASRKSRKGSRKSYKGSRKSRRNNVTRRGGASGIFSKVYSPISHLLGATENAVGTVTGAVNTVAKTGLRGVDRIGKSVTGHANMAVHNIVSRRRRANRK
jgi:hypothetical protein